MVERSSGGESAVLVGLDFGDGGYAESMEELQLLAASAGIRTRALVRGRRDRPDSALFAGSGKVEEIRKILEEQGASLAIFNHALSPVQERNLEKALGRPVVDRTRLILDIFGQRARSHEGKLQVELAQLEHAATRLVRGWTHLERQRGGRGFLGGMGETQLEVDRRLIANRVKVLKDKLAAVLRQRQTQRLKSYPCVIIQIDQFVAFARDHCDYGERTDQKDFSVSLACAASTNLADERTYGCPSQYAALGCNH